MKAKHFSFFGLFFVLLALTLLVSGCNNGTTDKGGNTTTPNNGMLYYGKAADGKYVFLSIYSTDTNADYGPKSGDRYAVTVGVPDAASGILEDPVAKIVSRGTVSVNGVTVIFTPESGDPTSGSLVSGLLTMQGVPGTTYNTELSLEERLVAGIKATSDAPFGGSVGIPVSNNGGGGSGGGEDGEEAPPEGAAGRLDIPLVKSISIVGTTLAPSEKIDYTHYYMEGMPVKFNNFKVKIEYDHGPPSESTDPKQFIVDPPFYTKDAVDQAKGVTLTYIAEAPFTTATTKVLAIPFKQTVRPEAAIPEDPNQAGDQSKPAVAAVEGYQFLPFSVSPPTYGATGKIFNWAGLTYNRTTYSDRPKEYPNGFASFTATVPKVSAGTSVSNLKYREDDGMDYNFELTGITISAYYNNPRYDPDLDGNNTEEDDTTPELKRDLALNGNTGAGRTYKMTYDPATKKVTVPVGSKTVEVTVDSANEYKVYSLGKPSISPIVFIDDPRFGTGVTNHQEYWVNLFKGGTVTVNYNNGSDFLTKNWSISELFYRHSTTGTGGVKGTISGITNDKPNVQFTALNNLTAVRPLATLTYKEKPIDFAPIYNLLVSINVTSRDGKAITMNGLRKVNDVVKPDAQADFEKMINVSATYQVEGDETKTATRQDVEADKNPSIKYPGAGLPPRIDTNTVISTNAGDFLNSMWWKRYREEGRKPEVKVYLSSPTLGEVRGTYNDMIVINYEN